MSLVVLCDTIDVVAVQPRTIGQIFLHDRDIVTIVSIQSVTGSNPDKTTLVLEHLCGKIA